MSAPPTQIERYHSIDIRPTSNDSDTVHSPPNESPPGQLPDPDPFSSSTNLTQDVGGGYPPQSTGRHAHFGNASQGSLAHRLAHSHNKSSSSDAGDKGRFKKLDDEKSGHAHKMSRLSSYDIFAAGGDYDTRTASEAHLTFAEGDFVKSRAGRIYAYLLNMSIITRWMLYIVPFAAILWIPGIVGLTAAPDANVWHVKLVWWSIWLSVAWVGWWGALAFSMVLPKILQWTIGLAAVSTRRYIDWLTALNRYIAFAAWSTGMWIAYQPLINTKISDADEAAFPGSARILGLIAKILFGLAVCAGVLLGEKFAIQFIAYKFHQRSYADRIAGQKVQIKALIVLYAHSSDIPGRNDTLKDDASSSKGPVVNPKKILRNVLKGVRGVAEGATTALGNVASEIIGSSTLQPSSPEAKVYTALASANKTRLLARRLFYSFRQEGASIMTLGDIARFFPSLEQAQVAFSIFDKDDNGDCTRDEVEMACIEIHRELLSLSASMKDIDSAVGRLDNILMSLYFVVAALIMAVSLDASFTNLLTGAGTLILGLSWLIGGSAAEVLSSIIFLFIKHPYDIGDCVVIEDATYTVKEIRLLSTIFVDSQGCFTQAPHSSLTESFIRNHRRSGPESEPFEFDVEYTTSFEKIEELRAKMLAFVESRRRDFQPVFDITMKDIPGQEKMVLGAEIKYKSNNHLSALKAKRRNMWICALKNSLTEVGIFGPGGDPSAPAEPTKYTLVPWDEVDAGKKPPTPELGTIKEPRIPRTDYNFEDKNAALKDTADDVFGETDDLNLTNPRQAARRTAVLPPSAGVGAERPRVRPRQRTLPLQSEAYEMSSGRKM